MCEYSWNSVNFIRNITDNTFINTHINKTMDNTSYQVNPLMVNVGQIRVKD